MAENDWISDYIAAEARRLRCPPSFSEDVQQDCALRYLTALQGHRIGNPGAYVAKVLRSCIADHYRRLSRDIPPGVIRDVDQPVAARMLSSSRDPADVVPLQLDVRVAISLLSARERAAIHAHYIDGIPVALIAASQQLPKSTIHRTLSRGRMHLRERGLETLA